ncbi:hypothetical protein [Microbacterium sp. RG1]|uniref:hypothetical protein n=1 Tax=Microbacterium sp. RG1 TaxID=2489212 RepID=UPI001EE15BAF|nr:hypothetical protein [Microbacterium sp. RG1]
MREPGLESTAAVTATGILVSPLPLLQGLSVPHRPASLVLGATGLALALALTGCASTDWNVPRDTIGVVGSPAPGFAPEIEPTPEATVDPRSGSWDDVHPAPGYRVVLLTSGDDATTQALRDAVTAWAADEDVDLRTVDADDDAISGIVHAMDLNPELVVAAGEDLIDAMAMVTPNHLDIAFLVLGAELAEPTENVTAVDWTGAGFRGEGLGSATHFDEASFTPERCDDAIRAGVAAVLTGMTGVVLWIS